MSIYLSSDALSPVMRELSGSERLARISSLLRQRGPMTRAELSRATGIAKSSISLLVDQLVTSGEVTVRTATPTNRSHTVRGRPGELVELNSSSGAAIGLEFGYSHIRGVVGDISHEILAQREVAISANYNVKATLEIARDVVTDLLHASRITPSRILGIGVALPVAIERSRVATFPSRAQSRWKDIDVAAGLSELTGFNVSVENDANLEAYAELLWGAQIGDFAFLRLHSTVGGSVVVNRRVVTGFHGTAGELGHLSLDPNGPVCQCGKRGCLDAYAGISAMLSNASVALGHDIPLHQFLGSAEEGDPVCARILNDATLRIGQAIAMVCTVLNPEAIVLGGSLPSLRPQLLGEVIDAFRQFAVSGSSDLRILPAEFDRYAAAIGAVAMVLGQVQPSHESTRGPSNRARST